MEIFGIEIKRKKAPKEELRVLDLNDELADAGVVLDGGDAGISSQGGVFDGIGEGAATVPADEVELIRRYREIAVTGEVDEALQEIRNEVFIFDVPGKRAFDIDFTDEDGAPSPSIQKKIAAEVATLYNVIDFHRNGTKLFDSWYINGKIHIQKVVDKRNPKLGILHTQILDPLNIRLVKYVKKEAGEIGVDLNKIQSWYMYGRTFDEKIKYGVVNVIDYGQSVSGLRIHPDSIAYADSGIRDLNTGKSIGYLYKALTPYNNLKMMEDAMVIFRVVRAPQRRAIYVDVGQLQKNKADGYMKEIMARFKNKMTYDSKTGTLADRRNILSMQEDYWLPRREGSKGTEITTIDGQDTSGVIEEVEYYRDKLWRALGVPRSRFGDQAQSFVFGKGIEIQRDEYRFKKFINNLRRYFLEFFADCLRTQLILKNIITPEDWPDIHRTMFWTFAEDNAFVEYKESEIINNRINLLDACDKYVGKYFTVDWVRKNVLRQTDLEIQAETDQMDREEKEGLYDREVDDEGNDVTQPKFFPRESNPAFGVPDQGPGGPSAGGQDS
ncbi:portal protein [Acidovorax phage ACP17]|uniref:Portal protein n=1 Tax=Acidovorax phage ACP17 TaxID=2010329 RepID=A0A218M2V0_9CAUD|nr:portal protein [Acidovorax phage ACP17]ASD50374.1 hypothetical protein [Acidovorax phage ACP17]